LQAAPKDLSAPVKEIGGVRDWLWKGASKPVATLEVMVDNPGGQMPLRHTLSFTEHGSRFELIEERIENERPYPGKNAPYFFYRFQNGYPVLKERPTEDAKAPKESASHGHEAGEERELKRETLNPEQSILSQVKDPERYPVLAYLESVLAGCSYSWKRAITAFQLHASRTEHCVTCVCWQFFATLNPRH